jgi:hypothetical protein
MSADDKDDPVLLQALSAACAAGGAVIFVIGVKDQDVIDEKVTLKSRAVPILLALLSGLAGAMVIFIQGELTKFNTNPLVGLPPRLLLTALFAGLLSFAQACGPSRAMRLLGKRKSLCRWVALGGFVYVAPLIGLYLVVNVHNRYDMGVALCIIPVAALSWERYWFTRSSERKAFTAAAISLLTDEKYSSPRV